MKGEAKIKSDTTMSFFIQSSNRNSAALPFKGSGPPRLYALTSVGLTTYICERLTRIAALAYCQRNVKAMEQAARELLTFDSDAALYYLAMVAKWRRRTDEARTLFESVRGNYQARAIQALGAIHFEARRFDEAARMHIEAIHAGRHDAFAVIGARFQLSAIRSEYGEHEQSFDDLLSLWPVVKAAAKYQPHLWPLLHNEIGYELLQLGRIEQARKAVASERNSCQTCMGNPGLIYKTPGTI